jgi:hypothetical protein
MDDIRIHDEEQLSDKQCAVQQWLTNFKSTMPDTYQVTCIGKCKLEDVEIYLRNPFTYWCKYGPVHTRQAEESTEHIAKYNLLPFPKLKPPTPKENELAKWLYFYRELLKHRSAILYHPFTIKYFIQYLQRDAAIYTWNASELIKYRSKFKVLCKENWYYRTGLKQASNLYELE